MTAGILTFIGNLIPILGVLFYGWNPFQVLMLYWLETAIAAGWTLVRIGTLPQSLLGRMTVNGRDVAATHRDLLILFGSMTLGFLPLHLFFLFAIFRDGWVGIVTGPVSFVQEFVLASGAWTALLFAFVAGAVTFVASASGRETVGRLHARLSGRPFVAEAEYNEAEHGVGAAVGGLIGRIALLQVGAIAGAWFAKSHGSMAPLTIVMGLKLLCGMRRPTMAAGVISATSNRAAIAADRMKPG